MANEDKIKKYQFESQELDLDLDEKIINKIKIYNEKNISELLIRNDGFLSNSGANLYFTNKRIISEYYTRKYPWKKYNTLYKSIYYDNIKSIHGTCAFRYNMIYIEDYDYNIMRICVISSSSGKQIRELIREYSERNYITISEFCDSEFERLRKEGKLEKIGDEYTGKTETDGGIIVSFVLTKYDSWGNEKRIIKITYNYPNLDKNTIAYNFNAPEQAFGITLGNGTIGSSMGISFPSKINDIIELEFKMK
jgi:hypothetical protein